MGFRNQIQDVPPLDVIRRVTGEFLKGPVGRLQPAFRIRDEDPVPAIFENGRWHILKAVTAGAGGRFVNRCLVRRRIFAGFQMHGFHF
jgi:hypothetical protein